MKFACNKLVWENWRKKNQTTDLEDVVPWPYIRHINPLAVNIMTVRIPAAYGDALVAHVVAGEPLLEA